jgi:predicted DCC family thiol-disulfide oxidoreductase YuxK
VDCGFCRWSLAKLLAWDRRRRLQPVALQSKRGRELTADLGEGQRMSSWHLVVGENRVSGGFAAAPLLRMLPGGTPLAALLDCFPQTTERAYGWIVAHRHALGRLISSGAAERARTRVQSRTAGTD